MNTILRKLPLEITYKQTLNIPYSSILGVTKDSQNTTWIWFEEDLTDIYFNQCKTNLYMIQEGDKIPNSNCSPLVNISENLSDYFVYLEKIR